MRAVVAGGCSILELHNSIKRKKDMKKRKGMEGRGGEGKRLNETKRKATHKIRQ